MADIVDRIHVDIEGEVIEADSIEMKISGNKEPIKVMNRRNRAIGHKHGVPDIAFTLEFPYDLNLETKFKRALANNTQFTTTTEAEGQSGATKITTYKGCEVYDYSESGKTGDNATISLEVGALDFGDN